MKKKISKSENQFKYSYLAGISEAIERLSAEKRRRYNLAHGLEDLDSDIKILGERSLTGRGPAAGH